MTDEPVRITPHGDRSTAAAPHIDAQRVAEKVYRLMLEDIRLERARAGRLAAGEKAKP